MAQRLFNRRATGHHFFAIEHLPVIAPNASSPGIVLTTL
jgi:hypothetical protein